VNPTLDNDLIVLSDEDGCVSPASPLEIHHPFDHPQSVHVGGAGGATCPVAPGSHPVTVVRATAGPLGEALVETDLGLQEEVYVRSVGAVRPGDRLLVRAGSAVARL
jgi:hypothetical protein